ncbi:hypothetical protein [Sodalis-like endosymbiont of Proechinophthirus fluctus]|nr:hypothetical protein [Sodalis-like endosymbiont of Proechinophthirus fluctus]
MSRGNKVVISTAGWEEWAANDAVLLIGADNRKAIEGSTVRRQGCP